MRSITRAFAVLLLLSSPVLAADLVNVSGASNTAINGFDPVAFFTDSRPVNGSPSITATYQGAVYFFATEEHRSLFKQNPAHYAPQYGGFCSYGVSRGALFPVDIDTWQVKNGKLYLNLNAEVVKLFNAEFDANVAKAEENWPELVSKQGV